MNNRQNFYKILTARVTLSGFAIIFLLTTIACGTLSPQKAGAGETKAFAGSRPTITVLPPVVEYKPKVQVLVSGSGFEPNQTLQLQIVYGGILTGIHGLVKPPPVPNDLGAFASVWTLKREISKKLIEPLPMVYTLAVVDEDGKTLCTAPLFFCDPKAKKKSPACIFIK
jgi:hypothetical protein